MPELNPHFFYFSFILSNHPLETTMAPLKHGWKQESHGCCSPIWSCTSWRLHQYRRSRSVSRMVTGWYTRCTSQSKLVESCSNLLSTLSIGYLFSLCVMYRCMLLKVCINQSKCNEMHYISRNCYIAVLTMYKMCARKRWASGEPYAADGLSCNAHSCLWGECLVISNWFRVLPGMFN